MSSLYPLKFKTIFKDKIWGGQKIRTFLGKDYGNLPNCGETWEISGVKGNVSVVSEGELKGKNLPELIENFKQDLLGQKVYQQFGNEFPLLIKYIDANDDLSIQVHPDDKLAKERHQSFGKTEMWYIIQADENAELNTGFKTAINQQIYLQHLETNTLDEILNFESVKAGDVYFLPAGRVHYIGKGICLAEIQQTSDITYRIYDFDRKDNKGNKRELHTEMALGAIDYTYYPDYKTHYTPIANESVTLVSCPYFTTNLIELDQKITKDYSELDSFVIYIATQGSTTISFANTDYKISLGDCLLLPACIDSVTLATDSNSKLLEVYIS